MHLRQLGGGRTLAGVPADDAHGFGLGLGGAQQEDDFLLFAGLQGDSGVQRADAVRAAALQAAELAVVAEARRVFIEVVGDDPEDLAIPGTSMTFGTLKQAQALGDLQALVARGRRVARASIEELESLALNLKGIKRIRFFMTFGQSYLTHLKCLENVGMTSIEPIDFQGQKIVPLQFLKALLPDPASLGPRTKGKTNIGCIFEGVKNGKPVQYYVYNICDHQECYREIGSQAISYTTGVPAMIGGMMMLAGKWMKPGVFNVEEFDPDPFMDALNRWGLPWKESFKPVLVE